MYCVGDCLRFSRFAWSNSCLGNFTCSKFGGGGTFYLGLLYSTNMSVHLDLSLGEITSCSYMAYYHLLGSTSISYNTHGGYVKREDESCGVRNTEVSCIGYKILQNGRGFCYVFSSLNYASRAEECAVPFGHLAGELTCDRPRCTDAVSEM